MRRWRALGWEDSIHRFLIHLLENEFQVIVAKEDNSSLFLIPSQMEEQRPEYSWEEATDEDEFFREYWLPFNPHGLMSRISVEVCWTLRSFALLFVCVSSFH